MDLASDGRLFADELNGISPSSYQEWLDSLQYTVSVFTLVVIAYLINNSYSALSNHSVNAIYGYAMVKA